MPAIIITQSAIRDFIADQESSGATSKAIAKHFGVNSKLVNTGYSLNHEGLFDPTWEGIYKMPGIKTIEFVHYLSSDSPAPVVILPTVNVSFESVKPSESVKPKPSEPVKCAVDSSATQTKITLDLLICGMVLVMFLINTLYEATVSDYTEIPRIDFFNRDNEQALSLCFSRERVNIF